MYGDNVVLVLLLGRDFWWHHMNGIGAYPKPVPILVVRQKRQHFGKGENGSDNTLAS